jgi:hypothetical protein
MKQKILSIFSKEDIITASIILACLFLYALFPTENIFQQIISSITFLLVIPVLYVKIILKKDLKSFGIAKGNWQTGIMWSIISLIVSASVFYILFNYFGLVNKYAPPRYIASSFLLFLFYEIILIGFFTFLYDFFFRGFLMMGLLKKIGFSSVFLQSFAFLALFFFTRGVHWSLTPYIIFLIFSGITAYFSRSILYSTVTFLIFNIIFDSFFIHLIK